MTVALLAAYGTVNSTDPVKSHWVRCKVEGRAICSKFPMRAIGNTIVLHYKTYHPVEFQAVLDKEGLEDTSIGASGMVGYNPDGANLDTVDPHLVEMIESPDLRRERKRQEEANEGRN